MFWGYVFVYWPKQVAMVSRKVKISELSGERVKKDPLQRQAVWCVRLFTSKVSEIYIAGST